MDPLQQLPADLPRPEDDGAARHLVGMAVPSIPLPATTGERVDLGRLGPGRAVVYAYPMTGHPDRGVPKGWDEIPGARGCTAEACDFRDHHAELAALGPRVFGLSTQATGYQQEMVRRLGVPFPVLSDAELALTRALRLPTFAAGGEVFLKRLTMVVRGGRIEHVFYPVFPPDRHAEEALAWLRAHAEAGTAV
jgi:peroxiredoxin